MKKIISILLFVLLGLQVFPYDWEVYSPPGVVALEIHFFEHDFCSALFSYDGFYLSEELISPTWEFFDIPADGAAAYNADTILLILSEGSYSDGIYFLDVNTHQYSVAEYCYRPNFIVKEREDKHYFVGFEDGMYESTDGHAWNEVAAFTGVECLDMAKGDPDFFAVACDYTENNVFVTYDDGITWDQIIHDCHFFEIAFKGYYGMINNLVGVCNGVTGGLYELNGNNWEILYFALSIQALGLDNSQTPYIGWYQGAPPDVGIGRFKMNPPNAGLTYFNEGLPNLNVFDISESPPIFGSNWVFCCTDEGAYVCKGISLGVESSPFREPDINIYPNPVRDNLHISVITEGMMGLELTVVSLRGEELLQRKITADGTCIDLSCIPSGIYLINVYDPSGRLVATKKLLKK